MLCYKDMTFCVTADCPVTDCKRHMSRLKGIKVDMPVSLADFGFTCREYAAAVIAAEEAEEQKP